MLLPNESAPVPTLLIVEDEFMIANDLRRILEKAGYQVIGLAGSVPEAMATVEKQTPDIVLLDIFLDGEQTGIDLAYWLREKKLPFVYLSANLTDSVLAAAKETQPFGFLNKPFREKDVLTTLEIARYRHAHSEEARLRQQQALQMAVNNAIVSIQDREKLCLAIADQVDKLVPFSFFNLRIILTEEASGYWLMLQKIAPGTFERRNLTTLLQRELRDGEAEKLEQESLKQVDEQPGIFSGTAFDQLCEQYLTVRSCRDHFGVRSLALFPIQLKRKMSTFIILANTAADSFTQKDYELVSLIIPPIALAINNLLAYEEIDARRQVKATELAIVTAFQNGKDLAEIIPTVAKALNSILPFDLLVIQQNEKTAPAPLLEVAVQKRGGIFERMTDQASWQWVRTELAQRPNKSAHGDPQQDEFTPNRKMSGLGQELKSLTRVSFLIKDQPMTLLLGSKGAYAFTRKDEEVLREISGQLAMALDNLVAFERIKNLSEQLEQEKTYLTEEIKTSHNFEEIVGTSSALQTVFTSVDQVARTDYTVLIMGETGTGKELIARALHNRSNRKNRSMVKVNCAALPAQLIESELFGHERGSFTGATEKRIGKFELASGSTIFLDEIGELPIELQSKLLRVIQEREIERLGGKGPIPVDVRIIAATNRNLQEEVAASRFRSDLYYRLNVFPITLPPLRERTEDLLPLTLHFLQKIGKKLGKPLTGIANASLQQMRNYTWPGNIRELEHVLERAAILSRNSTLELTEPLKWAFDIPSAMQSTVVVEPLQQTMRAAILAALAQSGNRIRGQGGAAELLNIKPTTLEARMKKLNITLRR
jgi:formate hydrogenlyase transcriptional activator